MKPGLLDRISQVFRPTPLESIANKLSGDVLWSESRLYARDIPKYNPDELLGRRGATIYKKMMMDEQVKAVVRFKRDAISARGYSFELEDDRLSDTEIEMRIAIYEEMVSQTRGSFKDGLNFILKAMWQGFSLTEKIIDTFEYQGTSYLGLKRLKSKPFETFDFYTDEYGNIIKLIQKMDADEQEIDVELKKFVYYVQNPDMDEHFGQSELREAYRSYYAKDVIIRFYNIFMERMASGLVTLTPKEEKIIRKGTPEHETIQDILKTIQSATGILLPSGVELDIHHPVTTDQFEKAIVLHDLQMAKALLVPNLLGISHTGQTGAFAQSQTQLEAFLWTLNSEADRLEETVNEQIFDPLSLDNFADGIGPKLKFKPLSRQQIIEIVKTWKELVGVKSVEASDTDESYLRELLDFPEKGEPLKTDPEPTAPSPPGSPNPTNQPDDDQLPDETVASPNRAAIVSQAAFNRAEKRVSVNVIDRKSEEILQRGTDNVSQIIEEMLARTSLEIIEENLGTPASIAKTQQIDFFKGDKTKMRKAITASLQRGWDLGIKHATDEINAARGERFNVDMARIDTNARQFLESNGFRLTGDLTDAMLRVIKSILLNAVKYSWTPKESIRRIYDRLTVDGFVHLETNATVTGRSVDEILEAIGESRAPIYRVKNAIRTNLFETINESRYSAFTDPELGGFVEALQYSAILDSRTTDICRHLNGRVYPVDSPQWNSYRPPNHFNCRSILVPVTIVDTDVVGKDRAGGSSRWSKEPRVEPQSGFGGQLG